MRYPVEETAAKHERIVKEASRLFRERGFENVSVDEVMQAAGLTHGAFYAHFGSKEELEAAAVAYGQKVSLERVQRSKSESRVRARTSGNCFREWCGPKGGHFSDSGDGRWRSIGSRRPRFPTVERNPKHRPTKARLIVPSRMRISLAALVIWTQTKFVVLFGANVYSGFPAP